MNIISDVIDSTPILGHTKAGIHYLAGDSEKGRKAFCKSTKTTAVIAGGAIGSMIGPGGAVAGTVYANALSDTFASIIMDEPQGIVKHCEELEKDIKHHRSLCESLIRNSVQIGFLAVKGAGINGVSSSSANSVCEIVSTVGDQILERSVNVLRKDFSKKVTKSVLKHSKIFFKKSS